MPHNYPSKEGAGTGGPFSRDTNFVLTALLAGAVMALTHLEAEIVKWRPLIQAAGQFAD